MVDSVPLEVPEETPTLCIPRSLQVKENQHFEDQHNCPLQAGQRVCDRHASGIVGPTRFQTSKGRVQRLTILTEPRALQLL